MTALIDVEACNATTAMAVASDVETMAAVVAALGGRLVLSKCNLFAVSSEIARSQEMLQRFGVPGR